MGAPDLWLDISFPYIKPVTARTGGKNAKRKSDNAKGTILNHKSLHATCPSIKMGSYIILLWKTVNLKGLNANTEEFLFYFFLLRNRATLMCGIAAQLSLF